MEISKSKTALFSNLRTKKMRERHGLFTVEGEKCVLDTLGAFPLKNLVATKGWISNNRENLSVPASLILEAAEADMKKISSLSTPPEVIAVFELPPTQTTEPKLENDKLSLLLDGIQDPGNLGTIIRTADWFGFDKIYASNDTVDLYNPKTLQSTMGSLKRVKVIYTDLIKLVSESYVKNICGTLLEGEDIFKTDLPASGVIIMGNEGKGLSPAVRGLVNVPLLIPPYNISSHPESLNVGIATGIVLAQFRNNLKH